MPFCIECRLPLIDGGDYYEGHTYCSTCLSKIITRKEVTTSSGDKYETDSFNISHVGGCPTEQAAKFIMLNGGVPMLSPNAFGGGMPMLSPTPYPFGGGMPMLSPTPNPFSGGIPLFTSWGSQPTTVTKTSVKKSGNKKKKSYGMTFSSW